MRNKILIVAAHPDDEILGCGGTILKFKKTHNIEVMFMTDGVSSRSNIKSLKASKKTRINECLKVFNYLKIKKPIFNSFPDNEMDSVPFINIVRTIEKKVFSYKPDIIITHFENCLNIDHQLTFKAVVTACRPIKKSSVKKILSFEVPSSTDWTLNNKKNFNPNYFVDISKFIKQKINALKIYKSEIRKYPHSRSLKNVKALAQVRGTSCGRNYAEAFVVSRIIQ